MDCDHNSDWNIVTSEQEGVTVRLEDYHGWADAYVLSNAKAEVVVVPAIARIMQFRLHHHSDGVFWENRELDGIPAEQVQAEWKNFGGEKTWPAPQSDWQNIIGRSWPPPVAFDSAPWQAAVDGTDLILTSPMEPAYGVQAVRRISLDRHQARLTVATCYRKITGAPVRIAVWVISQMRDAQRAFVLLPESPSMRGVETVLGPTPQDLRLDGRLLSVARDPDNNVKIMCPGNSALWVDEKCTARMDNAAIDGSRIAIYTNKDPQPYFELEIEGPAIGMRAGSTAEQITVYTLSRRCSDDVLAEARQALGLCVGGSTA